MMKLTIKGASVSVRFRKTLGGSVLKGTVFNKWESVDTHLRVESDEPAERLAHLIKNAKNGCFAESLITEPVPLKSTVEVNGEPFSVEGAADG